MHEARMILAASTRTPFGVSSTFVGGAAPLSGWDTFLDGARDLLQLGLQTAGTIGAIGNPPGQPVTTTTPAASAAGKLPTWVIPAGVVIIGGLIVWQVSKSSSRKGRKR